MNHLPEYGQTQNLQSEVAGIVMTQSYHMILPNSMVPVLWALKDTTDSYNVSHWQTFPDGMKVD